MNTFSLKEKIGKGSFGEVYRAVNKKTKGVVAIKILNLDTETDEITDVQREITLLSNCKSDYITNYMGSHLVGSKLWVVMDYADAGSLRRILKSGPLSEIQIALIAHQVLNALAYLHDTARIIHRDIKAANILLTSDGKVKLCDFGVAGQFTMACLKRISFVGTPFWMAPEIIKRAYYDFKADIWSFGITVIELATGNPPFADIDPRKALYLIPRSRPAKLDGNFSNALKEFISLCLKEEPEDELLETKFISGASKYSTSLIKDLVKRQTLWEEKHGKNKRFEDNDSDEDSENENIPFEEFLKNPQTEDDWQFDTMTSIQKAREQKSVKDNKQKIEDEIEASNNTMKESYQSSSSLLEPVPILPPLSPSSSRSVFHTDMVDGLPPPRKSSFNSSPQISSQLDIRPCEEVYVLSSTIKRILSPAIHERIHTPPIDEISSSSLTSENVFLETNSNVLKSSSSSLASSSPPLKPPPRQKGASKSPPNPSLGMIGGMKKSASYASSDRNSIYLNPKPRQKKVSENNNQQHMKKTHNRSDSLEETKDFSQIYASTGLSAFGRSQQLFGGRSYGGEGEVLKTTEKFGFEGRGDSVEGDLGDKLVEGLGLLMKLRMVVTSIEKN